MTVFYVSLFVCIVWFGSYIYFGKKEKHKKRSYKIPKFIIERFLSAGNRKYEVRFSWTWDWGK